MSASEAVDCGLIASLVTFNMSLLLFKAFSNIKVIGLPRANSFRDRRSYHSATEALSSTARDLFTVGGEEVVRKNATRD